MFRNIIELRSRCALGLKRQVGELVWCLHACRWPHVQPEFTVQRGASSPHEAGQTLADDHLQGLDD